VHLSKMFWTQKKGKEIRGKINKEKRAVQRICL
jgi:hypothetical protein